MLAVNTKDGIHTVELIHKLRQLDDPLDDELARVELGLRDCVVLHVDRDDAELHVRVRHAWVGDDDGRGEGDMVALVASLFLELAQSGLLSGLVLVDET